MSTLVTWLGWITLVSGGIMFAAGLVTFIPYFFLSMCWKYFKTQKDFIKIVTRYFDEKKRVGMKRDLMGTPE